MNEQGNPGDFGTRPSPLLSLVPLLALTTLLFISIRIFGSDALNGSSQIVLLASTGVCTLIAMLCCRTPWKTIETGITRNVTGIAPALFILLLIGALSGSWMVSGVVPTLIYYGMKIIPPSVFLASTCAICAVVSVITGSSWTTVATIGVALLGIGQAQGYSDAWIAGAIISGAYFGDKVSPLSDTTVLASSVTGTPLFSHIRYMLVTTVPSVTIALVMFLVAGFMHSSGEAEQMNDYTMRLADVFNISPWLLLVPAVTGLLIARKTPATITLFIAAVMAGIFALIFQPHILAAIAGEASTGAEGQFKGLLVSFFGDTNIETGSMALDELVATGGMGGMMNTLWLILCAMSFGGAMTASGMLASIISTVIRFMRSRVGVVGSTVVSGLFFNLATGDQYMSILLTGNMFKGIYLDKGYETRLLSRTIEDAVTVTSPLIPWNTCGMTQGAVLGVSAFVYLPYCFFNIISPLMTLAVAALGFKIVRREPYSAAEDAGNARDW
ncbi:MAG: sodium:proton antiporter [Tannerellaceae bacterium]|jgi:NhaC family Na+:H+ antiporter|nr:sodium:proton antiporter [Tannerellaceae bacterium]